jgi:hypothetical protein
MGRRSRSKISELTVRNNTGIGIGMDTGLLRFIIVIYLFIYLLIFYFKKIRTRCDSTLPVWDHETMVIGKR